jgi:histidinol-phosphate/aromatic aminotransferase/cobyric acid decarboxylase-like protein/predicted GNAT family N-acyltransferase
MLPTSSLAATRSVTPSLQVALATPEERESLYRLRHEVYAQEIGQHLPNEQGRLTDALDEVNDYLVVRSKGAVAGFISITPPSAGSYSIDKYFSRASLPFPVDEGLFEVRLLTVSKPQRGSRVAALLMVAAFRWIEAHGGSSMVCIGRREVLPLYLKTGLQDCGLQVRSGAVHYHLLHARVRHLRAVLEAGEWPLNGMEKRLDWQLPMPLRAPAACFHGGAFFEAIGTGFDRLDRRHRVINADVLDAWFPPAPSVLTSIQGQLAWLLQTSPPTDCGGLIHAIATARAVPAASVLVGAGSSDLIFRVLPRWLSRSSRVLLLDPTYGEYAHLLERVIGCQVERLPLRREQAYAVDLSALQQALRADYDLIVLVNPNSPTGQHLRREALLPLLEAVPKTTKVWVDETYVDFVDPAQSLEAYAAQAANVVVCKSMSKAYALSGARVAYLCGHPVLLEPLRAVTPPWVVSLVAQLAAVRALEAKPYYAQCWQETARLRQLLAEGLQALGWQVVPGCANFLLAFLPATGPSAETLIQRCGERGLFLRNPAATCPALGPLAVRIAVKDAATQERMVSILQEVIGRSRANGPQPYG